MDHTVDVPLVATLASTQRSSSSLTGGKFGNPWPTWQERGLTHVLKWQRERSRKKLPEQGFLSYNPKPTAQELADAFPVAAIDWAAIASPPADGIQVTWVGHATCLVQMGGFNFLTDPMFSTRASAVQFAGPARIVPPAFSLDTSQLPRVDFVVLSHNHYDHLDSCSVKAIHKRFGHHVTWYVPLGLKSWFGSSGIKNLVEMDWWQTENLDGDVSSVEVTFVPAQHWSTRTLLDKNKSLWGGYIIAHKGRKFWFVGDTGYCPVFSDIGRRFAPIDVAAIPIGAYEPRWFMKPQHIDPAEAVKIHQEAGCRVSIAIHWGTFNLTDEALDEPPTRMEQEVLTAGLPASSFMALQHGGMVSYTGGEVVNKPQLWRLPKQMT